MKNDSVLSRKVREGIELWSTAAGAYFGAAAATIHATSNGHDIACLWPANAILVARLLVGATPPWGTILSAGFVGNVLANLVTRGALVAPVLFGVANTLEIVLAAYCLRASGTHEEILASVPATVRFLLVAGLAAPIASAIPGSLTAALLLGAPLGRAFATWVASDALGLVVFTPFFFALFRGEFRAGLARRTWRTTIESLALLAAIGAITYAVFFVAKRPLLFTIFPPMMLITFRLGRLGMKAAVMIVAIIGGIGTLQGHGPMLAISSDPTTQAESFQAFLAIVLLTCLPVAAEVTARARLTATLARLNEEVSLSAVTDPLTGVLNRRGFETRAKALLSEGSRPISMIAIDVDHFKSINDSGGHQAGDKVLAHLSTLLLAQIRTGDAIGRLGGDEFVIVLPRADFEAAQAVAQRLRAGVHAAPLALDDTTVVLVSLSIGVASARPGETYERLVQRTDEALYDAKRNGRNTVRMAV